MSYIGKNVAPQPQGTYSQSEIDTQMLTKSNSTDMTTALALKANLVSPTFTGTPLAPTASTGDSSTKIATTEFVKAKSELDSIGVGQTWQNMLSNRTLNTWYTNNTGKPIFIMCEIYLYNVSVQMGIQLYIDSMPCIISSQKTGGSGINDSSSISAIIPNGSTYKVIKADNGDLRIWLELR
jgi:hypothetical protein